MREPEGLTKSRAIITEELIRKWFKELDQYINENNLHSVFSDPRRVLNGDETSFAMCPKTGKVIAPKGWKNVYDLKKGNEKESITVLLVFSAAGETVLPMVVFPYSRPPASVVRSMPEEWFLGKSETGWMRSEVFYEYIVNGVDKWLKDNNTPRPVILFIDGHKSHLTWHLSKWCDENGIILYALPPNCTHIMQPADVSVFKPLKSHWKKTLREWHSKTENVNTVLNKNTFCPLLKQCLTSPSLPQAIINGFKRCGLFPLDVNAVDYSKCIQNRLEKVVRSDANATTGVTLQEMETTKKVLNLYKDKLLIYGIESEQVSAALEEIHQTVGNENVRNGSPDIVDVEDGVAEVAQDIQLGEYEIQNDELIFIEPCNPTPENNTNNADMEVADFNIDAFNFGNTKDGLNDMTEECNLLEETEFEQSAFLFEPELEPKNAEKILLIREAKENIAEPKENKDAAKDNENETKEKVNAKQNVDETEENATTEDNRNKAKQIKDATKDEKNETEEKDETKESEDEIEDATKKNKNKTEEKVETKDNRDEIEEIKNATENNENETEEKEKNTENIYEIEEIKDATMDNKGEIGGKDETKKNRDGTKERENEEKNKDIQTANKEENKIVCAKTREIEKDTSNSAELTSKSFEDHLFWPGPLESQKRYKREKLPSAVSSLAYRRYLEEKELQKKNEQEKRERRKQERQRKANEKRTVLQEKNKTVRKRKLKKDMDKQKNKKLKIKAVDDEEVAKYDIKDVAGEEKTEKIKCSACDDELVSDVEDDDFKNLGCDNCERWFHLMCTEFVGLSYSEVQQRDFVCFYCT